MKTTELGQVFTKRIIADYMVDLFTIKKSSKILDPCFGEGAFIKACINKGYNNLVGMELDEELYNKFNIGSSVSLINADFLNYDFKDKFDGIIINPPYIRQENINKLNKYGITKQKLKENIIFENIPNKSNLYIYFIVKCFDVLNKKGQLIIIFPSSWINSNSENALLNLITEFGYVDTYVNVSGNAFEKSVLTNVCILKCIKDKKHTKKQANFNLLVKDGEIYLSKDKNAKKIFKIDFFNNAYLNEYADYKRGITTGYNEFFINPKVKSKKGIKRIISSPKQIKGFSTNDAKSDRLLVVSDKLCGDELYKYIDEYNKIVSKSKKPSSIYNKIVANKEWYKIKIFNCVGIIFGYIIRNNMKFVVNNKYLVRDNFYIIYPQINPMLLFALLNNYYVYYQLESVGKKYGNGVLKIQAYDFDKLVLPNINFINEKDKKSLLNLSNKLVVSGDKNYVDKITKTLSKYSHIDNDSIKLLYDDSVRLRGNE